MAIVSSIKIDDGALTQAVKVRLTREGGGGINFQFRKEVEAISNAMIGTGVGREQSTVAEAIKNAAVDELITGLTTVGASLKAGFHGGVSGGRWEKLSDSWLARKGPTNRDKFWKDTGNLAFGYQNFLNNYARAIRGSRTKVTIRARSRTYGKKAFSYALTVQVPDHPEPFITAITRDSFFRQIAHTGWGSSSQDLKTSRPRTFAKIGLLEGEGKYHRPFIAKLMADRGVVYHDHLHKIVQDTVARSAKGRLKV